MTATQYVANNRRRLAAGRAVVVVLPLGVLAAVGALVAGRQVVVVAAGLAVLVVLYVVERAGTTALTAARVAWAAERDVMHAAGIDEAERTTAAWLTALAAAGREAAAPDYVVGLWEWTCTDCRLGSDLVRTRDEAAYLAAEHDQLHHRARVSAHVHQVARLLFPLDPAQPPEVTAWPDAA